MGAEVLGLLGIQKLQLAKGGHRRREEGVCLMEAVAWFNDEPHSDHPACVDPVLGAFGRRLNDRFTDDERQKLVDLIPALVGTSGDQNLSRRRTYLLTDRVIRQILPLVYDERWPEHAAALRALGEVKDTESAELARQVCRKAHSAAAAAAAADADANRAQRVDLAIAAFREAINLKSEP
jgi:hypothetical protein